MHGVREAPLCTAPMLSSPLSYSASFLTLCTTAIRSWVCFFSTHLAIAGSPKVRGSGNEVLETRAGSGWGEVTVGHTL